MKDCVIFCAAEFDRLIAPVEKAAFVIAADGGVLHTQALGVTPDWVLGDFDSLGYVPAGAQVFPVEKDDTDAMLAVRKGLEQGCRRFLIYGGLDGPRLDHTVANFQTLQYLADHNAYGFLIGKEQVVTLVKNGKVVFDKETEGLLSVFAMADTARGVTLTGVQYCLENGTLTPGFPLGASNHFCGKEAVVEVKNGSLLLIFDRGKTLPAHKDLLGDDANADL